ncbi:F-box domain-containingprotein [Purpureocillium lavendulum]|uniref:F-box domain-containingprotein n=1 Tax=Purpureocillium lavendulum TaxID=1247861 RepID=A0AB34G462_9HYPO|nr:F-box domain-containingprotein [Purpureocillium lavendulum]
MLHQRHHVAGSGSSLQQASPSSSSSTSTTITGRSRFSKALPSVPLNLPLRDFATPRPLPKDLPELPPPPPPPSDKQQQQQQQHRDDDDDARSIKTIKSTKSVIARKPVSSSSSASNLPPAPPPKAAARVLRSPTASRTIPSPSTPSSSHTTSHTTSPPATAMAIPRRPVGGGGGGGPGGGAKKVTPKASTSSISTRTASNASASTVTVARSSTSTNTSAGMGNANNNNNNNGDAHGAGGGQPTTTTASRTTATAAATTTPSTTTSPLDPALPSPTYSISSLLSAYSREPEMLSAPAGSRGSTTNGGGGPHESSTSHSPGTRAGASHTSPPGSGFEFPAPPVGPQSGAGISAAAETPVTGPSARGASKSNGAQASTGTANGNGIGAGAAAGAGNVEAVGTAGTGSGTGNLLHGVRGNSDSSGGGNSGNSNSNSNSNSSSGPGTTGGTGTGSGSGNGRRAAAATAARQPSPPAERNLPPPPPPSKDEKALPQRPPPSPNAFPSSSPAVAATAPASAASKPPHPAPPDLPTPSPPRAEIWRRRPHKSEASRELPGLKLDHSHGSTASTAPLPQPPAAVAADADAPSAGPGDKPKSSQETIRAVTSPSSSPPRVSPPRPSVVVGLPGRNVRPAAKLHKQQTQQNQQNQQRDQGAATHAMGNGESKLNRIKGSLQKPHGLRKPSASPDKDAAANGIHKRDQNGTRLAALRPPTPEYHKEDVKSAPAATETFVSPASPASSSPSPVSLPADSAKALPPQPPHDAAQPARVGLTPSAPSIHGAASLQELNSSVQSPAGSRRTSPATDGGSSRTRESAESTKFPPRTSSTKHNWQKTPVEQPRRSAGEADPRIVLSDTQGPLYRGRDGTLYPEMKITREFDPKAAYFPVQKVKPLEPGAVIPSRPLQESHFNCYQNHRSMNRRGNRHYPLTCQTCDKADSEDRWVCTFCHLRICEPCLRTFNGHQRVLRRLVDELASNTPLSLSSMSRPGSALGIQTAT